MDYKTFSARKAMYLQSSKTVFREIGKTYKMIGDEFDVSARDWLSEDVDLSEAARKVFKREEAEYERSGKEIHLLRMRTCRDFFVRTKSLYETKKIIKQYNISSFMEAKDNLQLFPFYRELCPDHVKEALRDVSTNNS